MSHKHGATRDMSLSQASAANTCAPASVCTMVQQAYPFCKPKRARASFHPLCSFYPLVARKRGRLDGAGRSPPRRLPDQVASSGPSEVGGKSDDTRSARTGHSLSSTCVDFNRFWLSVILKNNNCSR